MRDPLGVVSMPSCIRRFASSCMWEWMCSWLTLELLLCYFRITTGLVKVVADTCCGSEADSERNAGFWLGHVDVVVGG